MTGPEIDHAEVYRQLPGPNVLLTAEFDVADVNQAYLDATGRTREQLVGRNIFGAFPDNPADPHARGIRAGSESMAKVLATGEPDYLSFLKYDIEVPDSPGEYESHYWFVVNAPVFGPDGQVEFIVHCAEEITHRVNKFLEGLKKEHG